MTTRRTLAATSTISLLLAACGDDAGPPEVIGTTVPGAITVEVVGVDFAFEPRAIAVTAGEPVNLTFRVDDGGHNLVVEGTGLQLPIVEEGDAVVATLTIDRPGTYRMVCTVPGHDSEGMVGEVTAG